MECGNVVRVVRVVVNSLHRGGGMCSSGQGPGPGGRAATGRAATLLLSTRPTASRLACRPRSRPQCWMKAAWEVWECLPSSSRCVVNYRTAGQMKGAVGQGFGMSSGSAGGSGGGVGGALRSGAHKLGLEGIINTHSNCRRHTLVPTLSAGLQVEKFVRRSAGTRNPNNRRCWTAAIFNPDHGRRC